MGSRCQGPVGMNFSKNMLDTQTLSPVKNQASIPIGLEWGVGTAFRNREPLLSKTQNGAYLVLYFGIDRFVLDQKNYAALMKLQFLIAEHNKQMVYLRIEGHTSSTGTLLYNQELSRLRAESVHAQLCLNSVGYAVDVNSYADKKTTVMEEGDNIEEKRSQNRRVEIFAYWSIPVNHIDLFPKDVFQRLSDENLIEFMKRLPNTQGRSRSLEEYAMRIFDKLYDPVLGKVDKKIMESKFGKVLKFFGVNELKPLVREKVFDSLYGLAGSKTDPKTQVMLKSTISAFAKQRW